MKSLAFLSSARVAALVTGLAGVLASATAAADNGLPPPPTAMDPEDALNPISIVRGAGIKVGEGTVLQPQIGVETGIVSNVFYEDATPVTAGLLRIIAEIGTSSLTNQRLGIRATSQDDPNAPPQTLTTTSNGDFQYSADLYATYDQYLSSNKNVNAQGGLGGGLLLRGLVNPQRALQLGFQEHFSRTVRATNYESRSDTDRDVNSLGLRLSYVPQGRALGGYLYYENTIDVFEAESQQFANRLQNTIGLRVNWQWLPLTRIYVDVSQGYNTGIGDSTKVDSFPLTTVAGIQTALTLNTTLAGHIGYTNGFYSSGPSYSSVAGGLQLGYRYSPLGRATFSYNYAHQDSINANFYRDHRFNMTLEQYLVPFVIFAQPELMVRQYDGTLVMGTDASRVRNDLIFGATAGVRYSFRDWLAATIDYHVQSVQTDFKYDTGTGLIDDPSYVRHELLLGVRAAY